MRNATITNKENNPQVSQKLILLEKLEKQIQTQKEYIEYLLYEEKKFSRKFKRQCVREAIFKLRKFSYRFHALGGN